MSGREELVKRMSELLKSGASMLSELCPVCRVPLFRLRGGRVVCPKCGRSVFLVRDEVDEARVLVDVTVLDLQRSICERLRVVSSRLLSASSVEEERALGELAVTYLEALERIRRLVGREE